MQAPKRGRPQLDQIEDPVDLIAYNLNLLQEEFLDLQKVDLPFAEQSYPPSAGKESSCEQSADRSLQSECSQIPLDTPPPTLPPEQQEDNSEIERAIVQHLSEQYDSFMASHEEQWARLSYPEKAELVAKQIQEGEDGVGAYVYLFQLIYHFRNEFDRDFLARLAKRLSLGIGKGVKGFCVLEILAALGIGGEDELNEVAKLLLDEEQPLLQEKAFLALVGMGYPGLFTLVDIANKDYTAVSRLILQMLARTKIVQQRLIVPLLVPRVLSKETRTRQEAASILLRLEGHAIDLELLRLAKGIHNHPESAWLCELLATSSEASAKVLLKEIKSSAVKQKILIIESLGSDLRVEAGALTIEIVDQGVTFPGELMSYEGPLGPVREDQAAVLRIDLVDFMASLHHLMNALFAEYQEGLLVSKGALAEGMSHWFTLLKVIDSKVDSQSAHQNVVLRGILTEIANENAQVRRAVLLTIAKLRNVNFVDGTERLAKALGDKDPKVRAAACQVISHSSGPPARLINRMIQLLKDSFWNVRVSACTTLGLVVEEPSQHLLESLVRCLKEGTINRAVVSGTLAKLGPPGVAILLEVLRLKNSDWKLKCAIVLALAEAQLQPVELDLVVKQLFSCSRSKNAELRQAALDAICALYNSNQSDSVYLKPRSLMPLLYELVADPSERIRKQSLDFLVLFGAQAQLLLVQGLTKDASWSVRIQCAKGLAKLGPQNFRALLFGLRDEDDRVRRGTASALMSLGGPEQISALYSSQTNQIPTILSNINDILGSKGGFGKGIEGLLRAVSMRLQSSKKSNKENSENNGVPAKL